MKRREDHFRQNMELTSHGSLSGNRQVKAVVIGLVILGVIWEVATWIVAASDLMLIMFGLSLIVVTVVVHILNDWRSGVLVFLVWLLFETRIPDGTLDGGLN
jgi:hypothetical protein